MKLIVAPLLVITFLARNNHIAWNMQSCSKSVHAIWMFNRCTVAFQQPAAVATMTPKLGFNCVDVFWIGNIQSNLRGYFAADLMEKHTHEFICHI